ncbi:MAG: prepilin-type N-terminal cleavage/methylation domain-containing protein [Deltaproteobacteria bacterium]|jgi:prepilin-type N-terminal cleavage/methylation domain-containing protein|nr:prepilin-type N-terminal cleavage/methylation domain-containing protein [Deltaproteobacteria bacterium]
MKKEDGFTLVEAMVVLVIFALLTTFGVPAFSAWKKKQDVEGEISRLHSNLQYARMKAYTEKVTWGIYWGGSDNFTAYSVKKDGNGDGDINDPSGTDEIIESANAKSTITTNGALSMGFDGRGFCKNPATFYISVSAGAAKNCVATSRTRIITGKWKWDGTEWKCNPE